MQEMSQLSCLARNHLQRRIVQAGNYEASEGRREGWRTQPAIEHVHGLSKRAMDSNASGETLVSFGGLQRSHLPIGIADERLVLVSGHRSL